MFQEDYQGKNKIYHSIIEKNNLIIFPIFQNIPLEIKSNDQIKIPIQNQIVNYKIFPNHSLIIVYKNNLEYYKDFNLKQNKISIKGNFFQDSIAKMKIYNFKKNLFIIIFGRNICVLRIFDKNIDMKIYKVNVYSIKKIISFDSKQNFTGEDIEIKCQIIYNKNELNNLSIQSFIIPYLWNEAFINFNILFFQSNKNNLLLSTNGNNGIVYKKNEKFYYNFIVKDNKDLEKEIVQINKSDIIDKILFVNNKLMIFLCNNEKIYIYQIENENINYKNSFILNKEKNIIIIKIKGFIINEDKLVIFFLTNKNEIKGILLTKDFTKIEKEFILIKNNFFDFIDKYIEKRELIEIGLKINIILKKHSILSFGNQSKIFYNKIIQNIKIFEEQIFILFNLNIIYIFDISDLDNPLFIINYNKENIILDFLIFNKDYLYLLIFDKKNQSNNLLFLDLNNQKNYKFETKITFDKLYNNIIYIEEIGYLMLISDYGYILFYNIDKHNSLKIINEFNNNFHISEVDNFKNTFNDNLSELQKLFYLDIEKQYLSKNKFIKFKFIKHYSENDLFIFHLLILVYNCGYTFLVIIENKESFNSIISLVENLKYNINNIPIENITNYFQYDYTHNKINTINHEKEKTN